jgi:protein-S-isoprenylcysteine O-methyltransferase Ste14
VSLSKNPAPASAILADSATPFLVVAVFFAFMDTVFVRFEEKKLSRTFGGAWSTFRADVRRWI